MTATGNHEECEALASLRAENASLKAKLAQARDALQRIANRGIVFDAKGTWSQEVNQIANNALKETE